MRTTRATAAKSSPPPARDHVAIAAAWQADVLAGRFPSGRLMRAAVERQARDLNRIGSPDFRYVFDEATGARAVRFLECLPHVDGPLAGELVRLEPWQIWAVIVIFGWFSAANPNQPRFRRATLFMPKGQGKTFLGAGLALLVLALGGKGEKVYSASYTKEQARLSFKTARRMLELVPKFRDKLGLHVGKQAITQDNTGGEFQPVSGEARTLEGKIPSFILEDEIHVHPTREVHDNLRSSAAKRPDSRMVVISTAGFDTSEESIGYEVYSYARQILEGEVTDESQFALLIQADEKVLGPDGKPQKGPDGKPINADPWAPETWRQANPNLGVSIDAVEVANEANEARQSPAKRKSFFTKRLGWWVEGRNRFFDKEAWDALADAPAVEQLRHFPCHIGLDLASRRAFASMSRVFVEDRPHRDPARAATGETERHYHVFVDSFLHEEGIAASDMYKSWKEDGHLIETPGNTTDYGFILAQLKGYLETHKVVELDVDQHEASQFEQRLEASAPFVLIPQVVKYLSPALKEMEAAILSGRLHHDGNRVMRWMVGNVVSKVDVNENVFPVKARQDLYIDGVSATLNVISRAMAPITDSEPKGGSYLDTMDLVVLG